MSTPAIDFSKYEEQAKPASVGKVDFANYENVSAPSGAEKTGLPPAAGPHVKMESGGAHGLFIRGGPTGENMGSAEGAGLAEAMHDYGTEGVGKMGEGVKDIAHGDIAKGTHHILSGGMNTLTPLAGFAGPATLARGAVGGMLGGKIARGATSMVTDNPDYQNVAEDIGNIGGAGAAQMGNASRAGKVILGATKGAAEHTPFIGPWVKGAIKGGMEAYKNSAPPTEGAPLPINPETEGEATATRSMLRKRGAENVTGPKEAGSRAGKTPSMSPITLDQVPGQPYMPRPRGVSPVAPIPARSGLMLPPARPSPPPLWSGTTGNAAEPVMPMAKSPSLRGTATMGGEAPATMRSNIPPEDAIKGTIANPKGRLILTPSEARAHAQMEKLAKIRAHSNGMQYAGGMRPAEGKVPARPTPTYEEEY